ncbi:hypothetical protein E2C01_030278 [Portunus trituberculatus]|uniref:Uncharacterized protein n=1 Tax=Portunus trituberculatus TaxID=210409 RepID=A0A5B7EQG1_PORTR|nr:hypothetical protein [Portunus trituberculatus]
MVTCTVGNFKPLDKWQSFKAVCGGIQTYAWTSARSHTLTTLSTTPPPYPFTNLST